LPRLRRFHRPAWCRECVLRWLEAASATVNSGRTLVALGTDRVGTATIVARLTAGCDLRGATETTSEQPGVRRYQRIEHAMPQFLASRFDVLPGGRMTTQLRAHRGRRAELISETPLILGFTTHQRLEQRSSGRLRLDPGEAR
jgi:hypothetical protein